MADIPEFMDESAIGQGLAGFDVLYEPTLVDAPERLIAAVAQARPARQLILAFDPIALGGTDAPARFAVLAQMIEAQAGARLPGARRLEARRKARAQGLAIADALLADIAAS